MVYDSLTLPVHFQSRKMYKKSQLFLYRNRVTGTSPACFHISSDKKNNKPKSLHVAFKSSNTKLKKSYLLTINWKICHMIILR